jgi:hypothetical protein
MTLATPDQQFLEICEKVLGFNRKFAILKGGFYYRPGEHGYTGNIAEAARYTRKEAEAQMVKGEEAMKIVELELPPRDDNTLKAAFLKLTQEQKRQVLHNLVPNIDLRSDASLETMALESWEATPDQLTVAIWKAGCQ